MPAPMPVGGLTMASVALTAAVVGNAYYQKNQFYPSVVYITKSNPSMAAIYLLAFTVVILFGQLLKKVFFGQLRAAEFEHLLERSFYAITETCLAFTVFRDDFSPKFVALFTVLLFLKAFHWLADSRVDYMERSPVITILFHMRVTSLLSVLGFLDGMLVGHAYHSTITRGASVQLVFGFEYAILLTVGLNITVKYLCHTIDLQSENPWENKAVYLLYTELIVGLVKVILYAIFMFIMIRIHTFPLFIIRPMYLTMRSFKKALNDVVQSRRAIRNMNTLYPDATAEELAAVDNVCIICREEMTTGAKKLPCGHIFHTSCLRSWFQRQQTCPTCRLDILQHPTPPQPQSTPPAQPPQQPQQPAAQPAAAVVQTPPPPPQQQLGNPFGGLFMAPGAAGVRPPFPFPGFPYHQFQQQVQQQQQQAAGTATSSAASNNNNTTATSSAADSTTTTTTTTTASAQSTSSTESNANPRDGSRATSATWSATSMPGGRSVPPFNVMPQFFPMMPFNIPLPTPPPNFAGLTVDELRLMEGRERKNVEARISVLRNIQTLLDAAVVQMNQYTSIVSTLENESEVTSNIQTTTASHPQSSTAAQSEPSTAAQSNQPSTASQSDPSTAAQSDPSTAAQSQPSTAAQSDPSTAAQSDPSTAAQSDPSTAVQSQPSTAAQSDPSTAAQSQPSTSSTESHSSTTDEPSSTSAANCWSTHNASPQTTSTSSSSTESSITTKSLSSNIPNSSIARNETEIPEMNVALDEVDCDGASTSLVDLSTPEPDNQQEMRRRRLERFSGQEQSSSST